jgi:hypothetical protein
MFVMEDLNGKKGEFISRDDMLKGVEEIIVWSKKKMMPLR